MATNNEATTVTQKSALIGAYLVKGTVGNVGLPGATILHFNLVVVPSQHSVSGIVEITNTANPPLHIVIKNVTGAIFATGFGKVTQVVSLEGIYFQSLTPPAIGIFEQKFTAHLAIDNNWNGVGGFSYGNTYVEDVPVKQD